MGQKKGIIPEKYIEINGAGTIDLPATTAYTLLNLSNEINNSGGVFSTAGGVITYTGPNLTAKVSFSVSGVNNETGTRSTCRHSIFLNGSQLVRTERFTYHRTVGDGFDTAAFRGTIDLTNGMTIDLRSRINQTAEDVDMLLDRCNLLIEA